MFILDPAAILPLAMPAETTLAEAVASFQRQWLARVIAENEGNLAAAARAAGMDRSNFFRLMKRLGVPRS